MSKKTKLLTDKYTIRAAVPERDMGTIFAFMRESFQFLPEFERFLAQLQSTSFASCEAFKEAHLNPGSKMFIVVEEASTNRIVACVGGVAINPFEVELIRLFVLEEHRRNGLARMLVNAVESFAEENGYERIVLYCGYESAQKMYLSLQYQQCGQYFFWKPTKTHRFHALSRVALLGGVHGNELIGIHLLSQYWNEQWLAAACGKQCKVEPIICNLLAKEKCVRFVDKDLNRCFALEDLTSTSAAAPGYEIQRALELNQIIGPKQHILGSITEWQKNSPGCCDYLIDMHSTTSNMGITLITLKGNAMTIRLAHYLQTYLRENQCPFPFNLMVDSECERTVNNNIDSITPSGFCLEVGSLAHGTLNDPVLFKWTRIAVEQSLHFIRMFNEDKEPTSLDFEMDGYELIKPLYFPRDEHTGCNTAMLHVDRIGSDFKPMKKGDALFVGIVHGDIEHYEEEETVFPCFYGEAAYFTSGIACWLCRKRKFPVYG